MSFNFLQSDVHFPLLMFWACVEVAVSLSRLLHADINKASRLNAILDAQLGSTVCSVAFPFG